MVRRSSQIGSPSPRSRLNLLPRLAVAGAIALASCLGSPAQAEDAGGASPARCGHCRLLGPDDPWQLLPVDPWSRVKVGGWIQLGYHNDETPLAVERNDGQSFNDLPERLNLHQAWLTVERQTDSSDGGWDWGFRADVMYGTDASKTQAFGNPPSGGGTRPRRWDNSWNHGTYGFALPQLYLQVARSDISVVAGHFYTPVGYESVMSPLNFFYSHGLTMFNSQPFTHTGALATWDLRDDLEIYFGWTLGWDTGFDQFENGSNWVGGFKYDLTDSATLSYVSTAGNLGERGSRGYEQAVILDLELLEKLEWVIESDWVAIESDSINGGVGTNQISVLNYLFYTFDECWKAGLRVEWWRTDGDSFNEITAGINYKPHANLTLRPEIRYDFGGTRLTSADGLTRKRNRSTIFGIDAILTF